MCVNVYANVEKNVMKNDSISKRHNDKTIVYYSLS